ncbi:MAG: FAD-binding oxidoreductase [Clostridia bacterium]|nr:FAD-binding oxidoreductase [Clostridia bacterium]MCL6522024.1 FAD-binding oxidoreductase [Bacillota bacterium]
MEGTEHVDVVIVGAGAMGSSLAYHLKAGGFAGEVLVVERDLARERSSTGLSAGGVRQQFGTAVNIRLARASVEFYEHWQEHVAVEGEAPDIALRQPGYLFLADERLWPVLERRYELGRSLGVEVRKLSPAEIAELLPEVNLEGLVGAVYGERDGFLDPYAVMRGFEAKARELGARFVEDEVTGVLRSGDRVAGVQLRSGGRVEAPVVVDAAGAWAGQLARLAGVELPVGPVRHTIFVARSARRPERPLPFTILPSGLYFREERPGTILLGKSLPEDPEEFDFTADRTPFEALWLELAERVPLFEQLRLEHLWSGLYDMNKADANAIIGEHPDLPGFYVITGFSGHGMMQAPAAGRALAELIQHGRFLTLDVDELSPARFRQGRLVLEEAVI